MDNKDIIPRIGTFFIVLGAGSITLFIISDIADSLGFNYLFIGLLLLGIGIFFQRKAEKPDASGRFEWLKSLRNKDKKD